jgi:hypothetical protein
MSVQKFRHPDDAARALLLEGRATDRLPRIAFMLRVAAVIAPRRFPTGVRRYRTLADADADRAAWQRAHVRQLHDPS